jgi:hypothetical protein
VPARISGKAPPFGCIFRRTAAAHWQNDKIEGRDEEPRMEEDQ